MTGGLLDSVSCTGIYLRAYTLSVSTGAGNSPIGVGRSGGNMDRIGGAKGSRSGDSDEDTNCRLLGTATRDAARAAAAAAAAPATGGGLRTRNREKGTLIWFVRTL